MSPQPGPVWSQRLLWLAGAITLMIVGLFPTFAEMAGIWWTSSTFNHCLLIVPISLYLIWLKRHEAAMYQPDVSVLGLVFVFANALLWLSGALLSVSFFQHVAAIGAITGTAWALLGNRIARVLLFPLAYLYFCVPEGEFLRPYLQDWTVWVLVKLLRWSGIPVFLEGRYLTIPSGSFVVAEACSGINYLIATLAVGTVFAYLMFRSTLRRVLFMGLAIVVPLLANGIRAYGIVMIADLSGYKYALGVDHFIYGWVFFGLVIFALFALGNLFSDAAGAPAPKIPLQTPVAAPRRAGLFAATAVLLALAPRLVLALVERGEGNYPELALSSYARWEGPMYSEPLLGGVYQGASQQLIGRYLADDGVEVVLEVAYYRRQRQGAELINQQNLIYDPQIWREVSSTGLERPGPQQPLPLTELVLRDANGKRLVWQWFDVHGHLTNSAIAGKLYDALARITGQRRGLASIAISTPLDDDKTAAAARLARFVEDVQPFVAQLQTGFSH